MGRIFCLMGKSSSGKDTVYKMLLEEASLGLNSIVIYTTRPIRLGEKDGKEYHFVTTEQLEEMEKAGRVIERRTYHTALGDWNYFMADDGSIDCDNNDYLIIGTVESYVSMKKYYGDEKVVPVYMEVDDGIRLQRALTREMSEKEPKYEEMCRRFLADCKDFSEEKLQEAGIEKRFANISLGDTVEALKEYIHGYKSK